MDANIDLFVCAHKDFGSKLTNPAYTIVCGDVDIPAEVRVEHIKEDISNVGFSEWQKFYHIWKHMEVKDYVGLMHYRRVLRLSNDINVIPPAEELLKECDIIVGEVIRTPIYQQYQMCHNIKDLQDVIDIIRTDYPEYVEGMNKAFSSGKFIICNTAFMRKEDFYDLCEFMFGVLFKFCERNGIDYTKDESFYNYIDADIEHYKKYHRPDDYTFREQARVCAYLSERIFNIWVWKRGFKVGSVPYVDGGTASVH